MLLHEVLEKAAASFLVFRDVLIQCRYRHSAHVAYCENSGNLNAQGEPFDVAVKFPREKESGLQCRVREIMLFDRNENGLEAHGHLQFVRVRAQVGRRRRMAWNTGSRSRGDELMTFRTLDVARSAVPASRRASFSDRHWLREDGQREFSSSLSSNE